MNDFLAEFDRFAATLSDRDLRTLLSFDPARPTPVAELAMLYDWFEERGASRGLAPFGLAWHAAAKAELARRGASRAAVATNAHTAYNRHGKAVKVTIPTGR